LSDAKMKIEPVGKVIKRSAEESVLEIASYLPPKEKQQ